MKEKTFLYGAVSLILIIILAVIIYKGFGTYSQQNTNKLASQQTIVLEIPSLVSNQDGANTTEGIAQELPAPVHAIAIILDHIQYSDGLKDLLMSTPQAISIGVSPYDEHAQDIAKIAHELDKDVFIELSFAGDATHAKEYDLAPAFDSDEIQYRLSNMMKKIPQAKGVYSLGNEEFLESSNGIAALINYLHKNNLHLVYGVNDQTSVLESDNESVFAVEACDQVINEGSDEEKSKQALKTIADVVHKNGKAILIVHHDESNLKSILNWLSAEKDNNINLCALKSLPKKVKVSE